MNKDKKNTVRVVFFAVSLALTVISAALRAVNLFFFFDAELGYYSAGAPLPIISSVLLLAAIVFFAVLPLISFSRDSIAYSRPSVPQRIVSVIAALSATALAVSNTVAVIKKDRSSLILVVLSAFCVVYLLSDLFKFKVETGIELGSLFIVRIAVMLATSYFDQEVQMNAPDKVLFGVACVSAMLFAVSEMKVGVGSAKPAMHYFSCASATLLCSVSAIPSIIAYHAGRLPESNGLYFEYYLLLGVAILSASRLVSMACRKAKADCPPADADTSEAL